MLLCILRISPYFQAFFLMFLARNPEVKTQKLYWVKYTVEFIFTEKQFRGRIPYLFLNIFGVTFFDLYFKS